MLGEWSKSKTIRVTLWTVAFTVGVADVVVTHKWWHAGVYILGAAICATMSHRFHSTIGQASVAAYLKGREHQTRTEEPAQVISIGRRR